MPEGKDKQAVLVIHGIGEQRPMSTLRGFVDAVWTIDSTLREENVKSTVWSKPDTISGSYELRRDFDPLDADDLGVVVAETAA